MDSVGVVVILKLSQFFFQIALVPEKNLVQIFASDGSDKPLGEGMRYRHLKLGFTCMDSTTITKIALMRSSILRKALKNYMAILQ